MSSTKSATGSKRRTTRRPAKPAPPPKTPWAERLEKVRKRADIPSIRGFWQAIRKDWADAPSYEAVRTYHHDREPPVSYLGRVAEVFEVRVLWLAWGQGEMTEELEAEATAARAATLEVGDVRSLGRLLQDKAEEFGRVRAAFNETLGSLPELGGRTFSPEQALRSVLEMMQDSIVRPRATLDDDELALARRIAAALRAPLDELGIESNELRSGVHFDLYVSQLCSALTAAWLSATTETVPLESRRRRISIGKSDNKPTKKETDDGK